MRLEVTSLGANQTVDYRTADVFQVMREAGKQFDIIYDTVGGGKSVWDGASGEAVDIYNYLQVNPLEQHVR